MNRPDGLTGELIDLRDAIRRVPRYAFRLTESVKALSACLDEVTSNPRWLRWLPFRIISMRRWNEIMVRADQVDNDATSMAYVGYFVAISDTSIPNPWAVKKDE